MADPPRQLPQAQVTTPKELPRNEAVSPAGTPAVDSFGVTKKSSSTKSKSNAVGKNYTATPSKLIKDPIKLSKSEDRMQDYMKLFGPNVRKPVSIDEARKVKTQQTEAFKWAVNGKLGENANAARNALIGNWDSNKSPGQRANFIKDAVTIQALQNSAEQAAALLGAIRNVNGPIVQQQILAGLTSQDQPIQKITESTLWKMTADEAKAFDDRLHDFETRLRKSTQTATIKDPVIQGMIDKGISAQDLSAQLRTLRTSTTYFRNRGFSSIGMDAQDRTVLSLDKLQTQVVTQLAAFQTSAPAAYSLVAQLTKEGKTLNQVFGHKTTLINAESEDVAKQFLGNEAELYSLRGGPLNVSGQTDDMREQQANSILTGFDVRFTENGIDLLERSGAKFEAFSLNPKEVDAIWTPGSPGNPSKCEQIIDHYIQYEVHQLKDIERRAANNEFDLTWTPLVARDVFTDMAKEYTAMGGVRNDKGEWSIPNQDKDSALLGLTNMLNTTQQMTLEAIEASKNPDPRYAIASTAFGIGSVAVAMVGGSNPITATALAFGAGSGFLLQAAEVLNMYDRAGIQTSLLKPNETVVSNEYLAWSVLNAGMSLTGVDDATRALKATRGVAIATEGALQTAERTGPSMLERFKNHLEDDSLPRAFTDAVDSTKNWGQRVWHEALNGYRGMGPQPPYAHAGMGTPLGEMNAIRDDGDLLIRSSNIEQPGIHNAGFYPPPQAGRPSAWATPTDAANAVSGALKASVNDPAWVRVDRDTVDALGSLFQDFPTSPLKETRLENLNPIVQQLLDLKARDPNWAPPAVFMNPFFRKALSNPELRDASKRVTIGRLLAANPEEKRILDIARRFDKADATAFADALIKEGKSIVEALPPAAKSRYQQAIGAGGDWVANYDRLIGAEVEQTIKNQFSDPNTQATVRTLLGDLDDNESALGSVNFLARVREADIDDFPRVLKFMVGNADTTKTLLRAGQDGRTLLYFCGNTDDAAALAKIAAALQAKPSHARTLANTMVDIQSKLGVGGIRLAELPQAAKSLDAHPLHPQQWAAIKNRQDFERMVPGACEIAPTMATAAETVHVWPKELVADKFNAYKNDPVIKGVFLSLETDEEKQRLTTTLLTLEMLSPNAMASIADYVPKVIGGPTVLKGLIADKPEFLFFMRRAGKYNPNLNAPKAYLALSPEKLEKLATVSSTDFATWDDAQLAKWAAEP